jgi:hypothetical protein
MKNIKNKINSMNKKLLTVAFLFISAGILSTSTFAQEAPGDSGSGIAGEDIDGGRATATSSPTQPLGVHFTRNNGDGTCGEKAQIRLYYTVAPTVAPVLTQIYYQNDQLYTNLLPITGNITDFANKGYISFCLPTANIPPAIKLSLTYNPGGASQSSVSISGTN